MHIRDTGWGVSPCTMTNSPGEKQLVKSQGLAGDLLDTSTVLPFTRVGTGSSGTWEAGGDGEPGKERRTTAER
jgi:hypothetical protein